MATVSLATWSHNLSYSSLPSSVLTAALRSFYNWVGCAIGGSNHPATVTALTALSPFFGPPTSALLGSPSSTSKADAQHAALINGIASHVHDYDDTHLATIIHPTGPVASALLAISEARGPVSREDFIIALIVGIEAECKVGLAVWPSHYDVGWHITSTTGSIGAAVAVSKLLQLSIDQTSHAIGIAATQVVGLREMFGSHTKSFHPGRAAQNGLIAALMAERGYTSSESALEAKRGWANAVCPNQDEIRLDELMGTLGKVWEIGKNAFKPFPCGIVIHPVIDGCIQLRQDMQQKGIDAKQIKRVQARVHPLVLELTGKKTPKDELQAKFSVYHGAAIGLVYGKATPAQYEDHLVTNIQTTEIRDKIDAVRDESLNADEAYITVEMTDGASLEKHVKHAVGSLEVPMTDQQLQGKFLDQVTSVLGADGAKRASEACWRMKNITDISQLTLALQNRRSSGAVG